MKCNEIAVKIDTTETDVAKEFQEHDDVYLDEAMEAAEMTEQRMQQQQLDLSNSLTSVTATELISSTCSNVNSAAQLRPAYQELLELCNEHANYFKHDNTERGQRLQAALNAWPDFIVNANRLVTEIDGFAYKYDFDEETPGNGYRSFMTVTDASIAHGQSILKSLRACRGSIFFRKKYYMKEVESCCQLLSSLCTCLQYLLILPEKSLDNDLLVKGKHSPEEIFEMGGTINQYCFYGRCLGFQFVENIRGALRFVATSMAGFSESFYAQDNESVFMKATRSIWTGGKYFLNPELRARRIVNISQNAKIEFCKSFWFLTESELMHAMPSIVGTSIRVNRIVEIPAEPLQLPRHKKGCSMEDSIITTDFNQNDNCELVDIQVPMAHLGAGRAISVRLLSHSRREGMLGEGSKQFSWRKLAPRSRSILFHCHGGGFVAQSSKSHELYLRDWAVALDVPILSVDYSLAPEAPYPRALEEVFYAYCWMLKHSDHLGSSGERIVLAGDSAGANLCIGITLKCIQLGVRLPDGIFLAYCPTVIKFVVSPSRMLCVMDPVLPFGFLLRCLQAYALPDATQARENAKRVQQLMNVRNAAAQVPHYNLQLETNTHTHSNSRRGSLYAKSANSSVADNSKWEQISHKDDSGLDAINSSPVTDNSSDTFASASYHSQTIERTDLPSTEEDNSLCVSFEDDSQPIVHYPIELNADEKTNIEESAYLDRFLDKYLIDTASVEAKEHNGITPMQANNSESEENLLVETGKEMFDLEALQGHLHNAVNNISSTVSRYVQSNEIYSGQTPQHQRIRNLRNLDALITRSPSIESMFHVPKDPLMSPYWASDEWLAQMPPTRILTVDMDPFLDDCIMLAKRLKGLGRNVDLEILKGLPHGFLNFTVVSSDCREGSRRCIKHLEDLLHVSTKVNA